MINFKNTNHCLTPSHRAQGISFAPIIELTFKAMATFFLIAVPLFSPSVTTAQEKPNIILINLDDADCEMFELSYSDILYPNIMGVAKSGINFTNLHVTTPLCGPSRACLYRGQYAHNTGICVNEPGIPDSHGYDGGFKFYREQGYFNDDLSIWMKNAGYRTMLVGKYLHHDFQRFVPPGWDDFFCYLGGRYYGTFFFNNERTALGEMGQLPPNVYRTTAESRDVMKLLSAHAARDNGQPFFLNVNPYGPHIAQYTHPEMIDRRRTGWWLEMVQPYSPDYNEVDTSDKRGFFGPLPDMPDWARAFTNVRHRERALACRSVDDMVGEIEETLTSLGLDDNTYIIITSDNGFQLGHHRTIGKGLPTDRSTRVPLFVKGPNVPVDVTANHLIGHIDLAPTIVKLAGGTTPDFVDGASFSSLLTQDGLDTYPTFRQGLLIENWASLSGFAVKSDAASKSLRTIDTVYTEWANGEKDFFNLTYDPYQLYNVYDNLAPVHKDFFAGWLRLLQSEDSRPQVRFSQPHASGQRIARNLPLRGLAEHSSNLIAVKLGIYSHQRNQFWNGTNWQAGFAQVDAELENPNSLLTFWNYRSMPTGLNSVNGNLSVWAWSYSPGKYSEAGLVTFSYDIGTE